MALHRAQKKVVSTLAKAALLTVVVFVILWLLPGIGFWPLFGLVMLAVWICGIVAWFLTRFFVGPRVVR